MKNSQKFTFQFIHFHLISDQKNPCQNINIWHKDFITMGLTLFDMTFFLNCQSWEIKLDAFYKMVTKKVCDVTIIT